PAEAEKDDYYRSRCLNCHKHVDCRQSHRARLSVRDHCASCHMPKSAVTDVLHATYTNHRIQAKPSGSPAMAERSKPVAFESGAPRRDVAMAQAQFAFEHDDAAGARDAFFLMRDLEPSLAADAPALAVLGRLYDLQGRWDKARELYQKSIS